MQFITLQICHHTYTEQHFCNAISYKWPGTVKKLWRVSQLEPMVSLNHTNYQLSTTTIFRDFAGISPVIPRSAYWCGIQWVDLFYVQAAASTSSRYVFRSPVGPSPQSMKREAVELFAPHLKVGSHENNYYSKCLEHCWCICDTRWAAAV